MKRSQKLKEAWLASITAAKTKATELQAKDEAFDAERKEELGLKEEEYKCPAVTAEDRDALDGLIAKAADDKKAYERQLEVEKLDGEEIEARKAPGIIEEGHTGQSKKFSFANVWKATRAANGTSNRDIFQKYAPVELEMSDRLKRAGYHPEFGDSILVPLAPDLLIEPEDEQGRKLADFSTLRRDIKQMLELEFDRGEYVNLMKRFAGSDPEFAKAMGFDAKADLLMGDDTFGGYLIPSTQSGRIIDLFRARSVLMRAGAQEIGLPPSGNISYPRLTSDPTFSYTDPDLTADQGRSQVGTGVVRLQAKSLRGYVAMPNDLLRYSSPSAEVIVRGALAAKAAIASDQQGLEGVGTSIAPKGLITYTLSTADTPALGKMTLHVAQTVGANGNTFEPEDVALVQGLYEEGNDPDPATGWIMRPMFWATICNKRADAVTAGDRKGPFLFSIDRGMMGNAPPTSLGGVPVFTTTQASKNRAKGAATNLHYMVYGNFRRLIHGMVGVLELAVSEHALFFQDKTAIRAVLRDDYGVEHEESFVLTDALVQA